MKKLTHRLAVGSMSSHLLKIILSLRCLYKRSLTADTWIYRGSKHQDCNVNYTDSHAITVIFHNLSRHFFYKAFLDSFRFMMSGLDKLASHLNDDQLIIAKQFCRNDREFHFFYIITHTTKAINLSTKAPWWPKGCEV